LIKKTGLRAKETVGLKWLTVVVAAGQVGDTINLTNLVSEEVKGVNGGP
jgi:hypothetical protein